MCPGVTGSLLVVHMFECLNIERKNAKKSINSVVLLKD